MKKEHYIIIIAVLVLLNIFSWRFWWEKPMPKKPVLSEIGESGHGRKGGMAFFEKALKLSGQQKREFKDLRTYYFENIKGVNDSMNDLRFKMLTGISDDTNALEREEMIAKMVEYKLRIEKLTMQHFKGMRRVCNKDQKVVFDTLLVQMVKHHPMYKRGGRPQGMFKRRMRYNHQP